MENLKIKGLNNFKTILNILKLFVGLLVMYERGKDNC